MRKLNLLVAVGGVLFASSAINADREFADIYTECGLGAMIAPNNNVVAAVTNVTWDLGTTAILSNASSKDSCKGSQNESAAFIFDTYPNLEQDLAIGNGEHLTTLMTMAGIRQSDQIDFSLTLRDSFTDLVNSDEYSGLTRFEKAEILYNLLYSQIS